MAEIEEKVLQYNNVMVSFEFNLLVCLFQAKWISTAWLWLSLNPMQQTQNVNWRLNTLCLLCVGDGNVDRHCYCSSIPATIEHVAMQNCFRFLILFKENNLDLLKCVQTIKWKIKEATNMINKQTHECTFYADVLLQCTVHFSFYALRAMTWNESNSQNALIETCGFSDTNDLSAWSILAGRASQRFTNNNSCL